MKKDILFDGDCENFIVTDIPPVGNKVSDHIQGKKIEAAAGAKDYLFKRIDTSKYDNAIQHKFMDNSFEAKARFG